MTRVNSHGVSFFASGNRTGLCAQCRRVFSSLSAFTRHQVSRDGRVTCLDPNLLLDRGGKLVFTGRPGTHGFDADVTYWSLAGGVDFDKIFKEAS